MTSREDLLRVRADDPEYRRLAAAESAYWQDVRPNSLEDLETLIAEGASDHYMNRRFTGDEDLHWEETICRWGTFRRGIALGTSSLAQEARLLATNPSLHLTFVDLSAGALDRRQRALGDRFPGRIDARVGDLNFLELDEGSYDMIVSCSTIHHVTNLEHLANQVNRGLAPGGLFFLQDYVGEKRFQFSEEKKRVYEALFGRQAAKEGREAGVAWKGPEELSPFCGVRSDEVLQVFEQYLEPVEVRTGGALLVTMLRSTPTGAAVMRTGKAARMLRALRLRGERVVGRKPKVLMDAAFLREVTLVSDVLSDSGVLNPGNAFVVYRKRSNTETKVARP